MKLFIHSQDSVVEPLKFGLVFSNLSSSNYSNSAITTRNSIIIIITLIYSLKWNPRQDQRCPSDNISQIKTANVFQMAAVLKLQLKINLIIKITLWITTSAPNTPTNHKPYSIEEQTVEHANFKMVATILDWIWRSELSEIIRLTSKMNLLAQNTL